MANDQTTAELIEHSEPLTDQAEPESNDQDGLDVYLGLHEFAPREREALERVHRFVGRLSSLSSVIVHPGAALHAIELSPLGSRIDRLRPDTGLYQGFLDWRRQRDEGRRAQAQHEIDLRNGVLGAHERSLRPLAAALMALSRERES